MHVEMNGFCDERFAAVRDRFATNFTEGQELGASVAVTLDGEPVVDLWAGDRDTAGHLWEADTIVNVYSTTKTMTALCVLMLVDRGTIDLDQPVASYWPEFAANGKEAILIRNLLSHTAGLSGFDPVIEPALLYDWDGACAHLAAQAPWWGERRTSGYHAITQGYLLGEVVRRVSGRSVGAFFREEVAEPLDVDFHIGLPASEDHRVAELLPPTSARSMPSGSDSIALRTWLSCPLDASEPATRAWRGAEIPAAGGTGNARAVARAHAVLACGGTLDGRRFLGADTIERILEPQSDGPDIVLGMDVRFGLGFGLMGPATPLSTSQRAFFWGGWGGSMAMIDLDHRMSVAYVMNRMGAPVGSALDLRGPLLVLAADAAVHRLHS